MRRRLLFATLYLSEGAPIGFLWWALPPRLAAAGVPTPWITRLLGGLALVWALKFLWAPLLDRHRHRLGGYRPVILAAQAVMAASLVPLAFLDLGASFGAVAALCLLHALAASTQDAAIDATAIARVPPRERGSLNGWMQAGMLLGRAVFGAVAVRLGDDVATSALVLAVAGLIGAVGLVVAFGLRPEAAEREPGLSGPLLPALRRALLGRTVLLGLLFALLGGAVFEALAGTITLFLADAGWSPSAVGDLLLYGAVGGMVLGALLGGRLADRWGARRATRAFHALLAGLAAVAVLLADRAPPAVAFGAFALFYVGIGLFTAAGYALFMDLTRSSVAATRFTAFMAMTNACEAWSVWAAGELVPAFGYPGAMLAVIALSLLAQPVLARLPDGDTGDEDPANGAVAREGPPR